MPSLAWDSVLGGPCIVMNDKVALIGNVLTFYTKIRINLLEVFNQQNV